MKKQAPIRANEGGDARAGDGATVSQDVAAHEAGRVIGVYSMNCVGPREEDREAYVRTRDKLFEAQGRERAIRGTVEQLGRRKVGRVARFVATLAAAVGLAAVASTPALATARVDLIEAQATVAKHRAELSSFVLEEKWVEPAFNNLVTTVGKNHILDTELAGSSYSVTGPYLFLIGSGASSAAVGDTMGSHAGWTEVGNANAPTYTSPRKTLAFSAAASGSKTTSAAASFAITSSGTVGGCGLVLGSGAVSTIDSTAGTLLSAGAFTGGSKTVANGDTLNVTYTLSL